MKRKERHHLKENELAHSIESARDFLETRQRQLAGVVVGVVVVALGIIGFVVYRQQTQSRGSELLAEAMVALNARVVPTGTTGEENLPAGATLGATGTFSTEEAKLNAALPKLKAAADEYPDSASGITARYHMASALAALGDTRKPLRPSRTWPGGAGPRFVWPDGQAREADTAEAQDNSMRRSRRGRT